MTSAIPAPNRLTKSRIPRKAKKKKVFPNKNVLSETVTYAPTRYIPAKVSETRPEMYKMKFNENDSMMMYETIGRALKTYEESVLSICCLSK
jgi:hypothetical protein